MRNKLIVLSFDALESVDLDTFARLPYLGEVMRRASVVRSVREVYPTLTYPIHTSIITGVRPDRHGIFHNQRASLNPERPDWNIMGSDWYWEKESIKSPTLVDAVIEAGGEVATVSWPVTAGDMRGINLPEIWPVPGRGEDPRRVYERAASPEAMRLYFNKYYAHFNWTDNCDMVKYSVEAALDIVRDHAPDLLLCHAVQLDHVRHQYGNTSMEVAECLRELDIIAGRFMQAARDAWIYECTNFVILGDHGQIDVEALFNMNVLLREAGFIDADADGRALSCHAYSFSAGFSTHIHVPGGGDLLRARVYECLLDIKRRYPEHIERVMTAREVGDEEGLTGDFAFVVEGAQSVLFENALTGPVIIPRGSDQYHSYAANHGHHPSKGNKPPFIAFGPDVAEGIAIESGDMMDICPTLTALAGVSMPGMEGTVFPILREMDARESA